MTKVIETRLLERIRQDPRVLTGKPVIAGTRISVDLILKLMAQGMPEAEILDEYPRLKHEDIQAALLYAGNVVRHEAVFPLSVRQTKR
jgi:uncharacterized protein (DUF433 family)